jgi:rubredoxin
MQDYQCGICGYLYEPANGDPGANIPPNTAFENLPNDWVCQSAGPGKSSSVRFRDAPHSRETEKALKG